MTGTTGSTDVEGAGHIVREKEHSGEPMTIDQALSEMELVGHDFYLFVDAASARPSVVYRRKGLDYGVIRLARRRGEVRTGPVAAACGSA